MKVMRLCGGLGNQMYQYACYLQLKKMYPHDEVLVDTIWDEWARYPNELSDVFGIDMRAYDLFYQVAHSDKKEILEAAVAQTRYYEDFGYHKLIDMVKNPLHDRIQQNSSYSFLAEIYRKCGIDWDRIFLGGGSASLEEVRALMQANELSSTYGTSNLRASLKKVIRGRLPRIFFGMIGNKLQRKKFFSDISHFRRPDFTVASNLERFAGFGEKENIYFGYYGDPPDCVGVEEGLKRAFIFPEIYDEQNLKYLDQIKSVENPVAIHARLSSMQYGYDGAGGKKYYDKAVSYIKKKVDHPSFFVFSDRVEKVQNDPTMIGLEDGDQIYYITGNRGEKSYIDMQLISMCKHFIIPMSTFSWWGAWLCPNNEKIIVTPYRTLPGTISF